MGSEETCEAMVIDPSARTRSILNVAKGLHLNISLIVATHSHWDHIASLALLKETTGAEFLLHGAEGTKGITPRLGCLAGFLLEGSFSWSLPKPDRLLSDRNKIVLGHLQFTVLHTPGHSIGGICLSGHGVVFTGDTVFRNTIGIANKMMGKTGISGFNRRRLKKSIMNQLMALPDDIEVLPGHGSRTTIGSLRRQRSLL